MLPVTIKCGPLCFRRTPFTPVILNGAVIMTHNEGTTFMRRRQTYHERANLVLRPGCVDVRFEDSGWSGVYVWFVQFSSDSAKLELVIRVRTDAGKKSLFDGSQDPKTSYHFRRVEQRIDPNRRLLCSPLGKVNYSSVGKSITESSSSP